MQIRASMAVAVCFLLAVAILLLASNSSTASAFSTRHSSYTTTALLYRNRKQQSDRRTSSSKALFTDATTSTSKSASSSSSLSWNQQALADVSQFPHTWVPLASVYELNPDRPNAVDFLGQTYIVYADNNNDGEKDWIVTDSVCPHRLAPLSEGRIERQRGDDGSAAILQCSYHGWSFNRTGHCVRIPQANARTAAAAMKNPACKLQTYSVRIEKNILFAWLWPEDPLPGLLNSGDDANNNLPQDMLAGVLPNCTTYTRDLPYSWCTLLENIVDPSHVPWAHHGLQGKRTDAVPINMTLTSPVNETGFAFEFGDRTMGMRRQASGEFRAPFVIQYMGEYEPKVDNSKKKKKKQKASEEKAPPKFFNLTTVLIPTKPGWSRIIIFGSQQVKDENSVQDSAQKETPIAKIFRKLPGWLVHILSDRFLDSDLAFLHYQDRERPRRAGGTNSTAGGTFGYFMPAPADRCIVALRNWVHDYAFILGPLPLLETNRKVLFDRWAQHSDQCKHCHAAVTGLKTWRNRTFMVLSACIVFYKFLVARLGIVACLLMLRTYNLIEQSLKEGEFKHYEND